MRLRKRGGVWHARFYDSNGKRIDRSTKCTDKKAAEALARQWELEAADPDYATANKTTLGQILTGSIQDFMELAAVGKKAAATVEFHRVKAGHWLRLLEQGGAVPFPAHRLRARHVDDYISTRRNEGAGENTIAKELIVLRKALKRAKRRGEWRGEIDAVMPSGFAPEYKPKKRALSPEELQKLLAELTPDQAARTAFIVATSACWGETVRARRQDAQEGLVHIRGTKRTSRLRDVPIVSPAQQSLLKHALTYAEGVDGLLFRPWHNVSFRQQCVNSAERSLYARGLEAVHGAKAERRFGAADSVEGAHRAVA